MAKNQVFHKILLKNPNFQYFSEISENSIKKLEKFEKKNFLTPKMVKNGKNWIFLKKSLKNDLCPNLAIFYLGKIFKLWFFLEKNQKKGLKLLKNLKK